MDITSLQVCNDSEEWLKGSIPGDHHSPEIDSSSISPIAPYSEEDILACSLPMMETRLRPHQQQSPKCPRCESARTKFCYYNNYSLSQPRFFCKTCRRYWTQGGTLRNIPVGGGLRKNKKVASNSKKSTINHDHNQSVSCNNNHSTSTDHLHLQLAFPEQMQFSSHNFNNLPTGYIEENRSFMEGKYENSLMANHDFVGNYNGGSMVNYNYNFMHGMDCSPFGMSHLDELSGGNSSALTILESFHLNQNQGGGLGPNSKILSLEWNDGEQACNFDSGRGSFGNPGGVGSWTGLRNGFGSSAT